MISESLIISIILAGTALVSYIIRLSFLSKCDVCNLCWGAISIHRNTKEELQTVSNRNINHISHPIAESMTDIENK